MLPSGGTFPDTEEIPVEEWGPGGGEIVLTASGKVVGGVSGAGGGGGGGGGARSSTVLTVLAASLTGARTHTRYQTLSIYFSHTNQPSLPTFLLLAAITR